MPPHSQAAVPRSFWQRRVRDPLVAQLTQGITPEKIALTIAVGSALALFPILGTTTLLCFVVGLWLKLNQPIIQLINQALWPVHLPAIFWCVRLGERLLGAEPVNLPHLRSLIRAHPLEFMQQFGSAAEHAILGWAVVAPVYVAVVYFVSRQIARSVQRVKQESAASQDHPVP